jgi:hypothetical protein
MGRKKISISKINDERNRQVKREWDNFILIYFKIFKTNFLLL